MFRRAQLFMVALAVCASVHAKDVKTVNVDCSKGESIQSAVDGSASPVTIEVRGICLENVVIVGKVVALRGADPATDGVQGVTGIAAVSVEHIRGTSLENLSISNGSPGGVRFAFAEGSLKNCRIEGNAAGGLRSMLGSAVVGENLTISNNGGRGVLANDAQFFCIGCRVENNVQGAAAAVRGGILSLLDSVVTGRNGIQASEFGYADIDCISESTTHPCSMNVTGRAATAFNGGTAALWGAGDFTGQVGAFDRAHVLLYGARQLVTAQPGMGPTENNVDSFATLATETVEETGATSQLFGTTSVSRFGRAVLGANTVLSGTVQCSDAGDAWVDPTVVKAPGSVVGCEHAP